ncbi:hypothetical protein RJ639_002039 [Escallonia herrerae]|uniref:Uncharacterized protein n=1 Tax=Escallonia herrerae TaxID=1293975 RepID=A0AA88XRW0_9ASTE|nr:hypothetical protein RJ639_002039 [Escallonia herrerae]
MWWKLLGLRAEVQQFFCSIVGNGRSTLLWLGTEFVEDTRAPGMQRLNSMIGIISEEKVDSFNMPLYFPSAQELERVIVMNNKFTIERMEFLSQPEKESFDPILKSLHMRAIAEGIIRDNFGPKIVDSQKN